MKWESVTEVAALLFAKGGERWIRHGMIGYREVMDGLEDVSVAESRRERQGIPGHVGQGAQLEPCRRMQLLVDSWIVIYALSSNDGSLHEDSMSLADRDSV